MCRLFVSESLILYFKLQFFQMPQISNRGLKAYDSPIRSLIPFADAAETRGTKVYYLNIGQPDIPTPPNAIDAVRQIDIAVLKYAPALGNISYREKLTEYYRRFDVELSASNLMVTTGASEAIFLAMMSCLDEGDEVIIPEPFYAIYNGFSNIAKVKIVPITCEIETGFQLPEIADFERVVSKRTKAIFICNPNNPTGCLYSETALKELAMIVKKHNLFLFVDEVYREFCYDGQSFFSALNLLGLEENVIVLDSISKRFSACGARIGTMVTRNQGVMDAAVRFARYRLSPPALGQILAEATIDTPNSYINNAREEYDLRRLTLFERLNKMEGITCYLPGGAFYNFIKLPVDDAGRFCKWLLTDFEYNGSTVMISPGEGFYATAGLGKQEVRIAYVLNVTDLHKAMDCLEEALKVYPGRVPVSRITIGAAKTK
jgi:aspartate aminotransferase